MFKREMEKVTIRLFKGQKGKLDSFFPDVGYNAVIRQITDVFIKRVEAATNQTAKPIKATNIDIGDLIDKSITDTGLDKP